MTLTQNGIDYICQKFGDVNECCINTGVSWFYTREETDYPENGGTAQIVARLASGLIDSLTMTNPARGTFTQAELNTANGQSVTITDAQTITNHDEPSEDQWCYSAPTLCSSYNNQTDCINASCYWWNNSCHDAAPTCSQINNQTDCVNAGCYWWTNNTCNSTPEQTDCASYTNPTTCINAGCYWWNNSCHDASPTCAQINNQTDCVNNGCYWWSNGTCSDTEEPTFCSSYTNPTDCINNNCYWWNNSCHELEPTCAQINNQSDCAAFGCYWWSNGTCNSTAEPPACSTYTNPTDCWNHNCYWWSDGTCHNVQEGQIEWNVWIPVSIGLGAALIAGLLWKTRKKKS